jgi:hypothetical protein
MKLCSASRASASVAVTRNSILSTREVSRVSPPEKWERPACRIERLADVEDLALPSWKR